MPAHKDININHYNQKRLKLLEMTQSTEKIMQTYLKYFLREITSKNECK